MPSSTPGQPDPTTRPDPTPDPAFRHHNVATAGGRIHVAEAGDGPLVLLVHGFPESWYSWRHQLTALAAAGFRAAAIDVRGYGRSSKPAATEAYRMTELVADNVAVVRALGEDTATIVGHDWGSPIAATSALLHPEVFTAVALLSIAYSPAGGGRPTENFAKAGGDDLDFYISYFQEPGVAEGEAEPDIRGWLRGIYTALSGTGTAEKPADADEVYFIPRGGRMLDRFDPGTPLPAWLTDEDLDVYAGEFERTGLTGGLNRYRNVDRDWEDLAPREEKTIHQPSLFIGGSQDASVSWLGHQIKTHETSMPGIRGSHILEGAGHWIQQERPEEVNDLLLAWLRGLAN